MSFEHILPVIALLLGWFLNSLTPVFQERRDNRKALGKAIADLLEIRHNLLARQIAMEQIKKFGPLTPAEERVVWNLVSKSMPETPDLSKRYDEAVTLISSSDPLLGFQLRSKDCVSKMGSIFSQIEAQVGESISMLTEMEAQIYRAVIPHINEVIVDLARHRGGFFWYKIRHYIGKKVEIPEEAESFLSALKVEIERVRVAEMQATQSQPTIGNHMA